MPVANGQPAKHGLQWPLAELLPSLELLPLGHRRRLDRLGPFGRDGGRDAGIGEGR